MQNWLYWQSKTGSMKTRITGSFELCPLPASGQHRRHHRLRLHQQRHAYHAGQIIPIKMILAALAPPATGAAISPALMTSAAAAPDPEDKPSAWDRRPFRGRSHRPARSGRDLCGAEPRPATRRPPLLKGRTLINLFFEASTRTQSSFELAGKRLGADVLNMSVKTSSVSKGETLIDTASTLNAMRPDILVVRHQDSGAAELLSRKLDCSVINAGDGAHEHPTQALLDALTIRRRRGSFEGLIVAICGDILHSRVARSNIRLLVHDGRAGAAGRAAHACCPPRPSASASRSSPT